LFQERLKKKQEGNPIEQQYKLILNSAYGKTLLKSRDLESKYIPNAQKHQYLKRHYNSVERCDPCGNDHWKFVQTKPLISHENYVHCGGGGGGRGIFLCVGPHLLLLSGSSQVGSQVVADDG
jgi:hypothetical protein